MRHRLVHDYGRIDPHRIYSVLKHDLPELLDQIRLILKTYDPEPGDCSN